MKKTAKIGNIVAAAVGAILSVAAWTDSSASAPSTGSFTVSPAAPQTAGTRGPVILTVTTGKEGLQPNGYVLIHWSAARGSICYKLSSATVTGGQADSVFDLLVNTEASDPAHKDMGFARLTMKSGSALAAGVTITLRGTMNYAPQDTCRFTLQAVVHPDGSATEYAFQQVYPISVVYGPPARIWVSAEARPIQSGTARLTVAIVDANNNPVRDFQGAITASANTTVTGLPLNYEFSATDGGSHDFALSFPTAGKVARVTVTSGSLIGVSNPILPRTPAELGIYFGDIHTHTELSDGTGTADEAYGFGKRIAGLDFGAVTDHGPRDLSAKWVSLKDAATPIQSAKALCDTPWLRIQRRSKQWSS